MVILEKLLMEIINLIKNNIKKERYEYGEREELGKILKTMSESKSFELIDKKKEDLKYIDLGNLEKKEKISFLMNLYHFLYLFNILKQKKFTFLYNERKEFESKIYYVNEANKFKLNMTQISKVLRSKKIKNDDELNTNLKNLDLFFKNNLVHFNLSIFTDSSPVLYIFDSTNLNKLLSENANSYLEKHFKIYKSFVYLPYFLIKYKNDFGDLRNILSFISNNITTSNKYFSKLQNILKKENLNFLQIRM
jgi:hypothetical protein